MHRLMKSRLPRKNLWKVLRSFSLSYMSHSRLLVVQAQTWEQVQVLIWVLVLLMVQLHTVMM